MRVLGVDFGQRRLGLALSDHTGTLARPWQTVSAGPTPAASAKAVARLMSDARAKDEDEAVGAIVVGLPRRLSGEDTDQSQPAREFAQHLAALTGVDVQSAGRAADEPRGRVAAGRARKRTGAGARRRSTPRPRPSFFRTISIVR